MPSQMLPTIFREKNTHILILLSSIFIPIPKPDKDTTRKEEYRSIFIRNLYMKILYKIITTWIPQHNKRIIYHNQVLFIPGFQGWFIPHKSINIIHHIDIMNDKNCMILRIETGIVSYKTKYSIMIKSFQQICYKRSTLQHNKSACI